MTVALPFMKGTFAATSDQISWIMVAFVVGSAVSSASIGWFANRYGRRSMFIMAIIGFAASLVGCALSPSLEAAVFWRFVQGLSGAALLPLGQTIALNAMPDDRFSLATSVWALGFVSMGIISPTFAGYIIEADGWPLMFGAAVPVVLVLLVISIAVIEPDEPDPQPMDWLGFSTLLLALGCLQLGLSRGERLGWMDSTEVMASLLAAAAFFWMFIVQSKTSKTPFISPELFKNRNYVMGSFFVFMIGAVMFLPLLFMPLVLERVADFPANEIGLAFAPRGVGSVLGFLFMARYGDNVDPRFVLAFGLISLMTAAWMMSLWSVNVTFYHVVMANLVYGLSAASIWAPLNRITLSSLPKHLRNVGFPLFYLNFEMGSAIGTALFVSLYSRMVQSSYTLIGYSVTPYRESFSFLDRTGGWDRKETTDMAALASEIGRQAEMIAFTNTSLAMVAVFAAMIPVVLMLQRR